jgi:hypothetical protein
MSNCFFASPKLKTKKGVHDMKKRILSITGITTLILFAVPKAQDLCTQDFLQNGDFEVVDNLGIPIDWNKRDDSDEMKFEVEEGILKIQVMEGGNHDNGQVLVLGQTPTNEDVVIGRIANDTVYVRAWVKSTAINKPTIEELYEKFKERNPNRDTSGTNFYHNVSSNAGFQLAVQEAKKPGGPPWFIPVEWTPVYDHDGAAIEDWTPVNGKVVIGSNSNYICLWILIRSKSACTVWLDNIQMSSSPDFCNEPFESPGSVAAKYNNNVRKEIPEMGIRNTKVHFKQPSSYTLHIYKPNGTLCISQKGYASEVDILFPVLSSGAYIIDVKTNDNHLVSPIIIKK